MINPNDINYSKEDFNKDSDEDDFTYDLLIDMPSFDDWQDEQSKEKSEADPKKIELFNQFADFFKKDGDIKQALVELAPNEQELYNGDAAVNYADKLYSGTKDITDDIKSIMKNFYKSEDLEKRLEQIEADVIDAGANPNKLTQVYKKDFSNMSEDLNNNIRKEIVGYNAVNNPHQFDEKVSSINEILHLIHSSIVNDEKILQALPVLETSDYGETTLYGTESSENPVAKAIFGKVEDSDESSTDIVSLSDRTLMMVRDRGHALTIDIKKDEDDKYYVNYFVPKICNVDKVNMLPGVRKVIKREGEPQDKEFTTGVFSVENEDDVADAVMILIEMVPTDFD